MITPFPLRFRRLSESDILFSNEAGSFFVSNDSFLRRLVDDNLSNLDLGFLFDKGMAFESEGELNHIAYLTKLARSVKKPSKLSYVILVPTLRCDLSCSYCQVSRVNQNASGFDWSADTLSSVLSFLDENCGDYVQIEFQGGEPTLRLDLINEVIEFCRGRFLESTFVICSNLSEISEDFFNLMKSEDVFISTSLDGSRENHKRQRIGEESKTDKFFKNLKIAATVAEGRVSALPTLDPGELPTAKEILDTYEEYGIYSIFLRPIFFHGFARKKHPSSQYLEPKWKKFYRDFVYEVIKRNSSREENLFDEYYLLLALKRITGIPEQSHVDLRSSAWLGFDHLLIDYDGFLYPSDEARMLARSGNIDLSIGDLDSGISQPKRDALQGRAFNALDAWCSQCVYQTACGSDPIDDLARHGRADVPRPQTAFCKKNMNVFDLAIEILLSKDDSVQKSVMHWLDLPSALSPLSVYK